MIQENLSSVWCQVGCDFVDALVARPRYYFADRTTTDPLAKEFGMSDIR